MGVVTDVTAWTERALGPFGAGGLFVLAFAEASFFPVPPDLLLLSLGLANPSLAPLYALVATAGSVAGAAAGYGIGRYGGHPLAIRLVGHRSVDRAEAYYARYGVWAVVVAAVTPLPFKVFTILSGVLELRVGGFLAASAVGRGLRFGLEGLALFLWGDAFIGLLDDVWWGVLLATLAAVLAYAAYERRRRRAPAAPVTDE